MSDAVARAQHERVLRYRDARSHGSGRQAARAFRISESGGRVLWPASR